MLKTLTKYFNTFANTGFGCLECSPAQPDLPGAPGICTFQGFAGTRGAPGTRPGVQRAAEEQGLFSILLLPPFCTV